MFPKSCHKLGVSITSNKLWHLMMLDAHIEDNLANLKVVAIIIVRAIFANLEN
jgi:hypothetical protein